MKTYGITLNGKQYTDLEGILRCNNDLSKRLAESKEMNGYDFFSCMVFELKSLIDCGCSVDAFGIPILKTVTKEIYLEDENYFLRQIHKNIKNFQCDHEFNIKIQLKF